MFWKKKTTGAATPERRPNLKAIEEIFAASDFACVYCQSDVRREPFPKLPPMRISWKSLQAGLIPAPPAGATPFELPWIPERRTVPANAGKSWCSGANHYQCARRKSARHCRWNTPRFPERKYQREIRLRLIG